MRRFAHIESVTKFMVVSGDFDGSTHLVRSWLAGTVSGIVLIGEPNAVSSAKSERVMLVCLV